MNMGKRKGGAGEDDVANANGDDDGENHKRRKFEEPKGLEIYWKLSSINPSERQAAAVALAKEIQAAQRNYESSGKKSEEDILLGSNEKMQGCSPELQYALPRLVRGAASSNQGARQGFSLALTTLSAVEPSVTAELLLTLIDNEIDVSAGLKSQELKDGLLGRLFCYAAIVRAERFIGKGKTKDQVELIQKITEELLRLAQKKTFLREAATCALLELIDRLPSKELQESVFAVPDFEEWLKAAPVVGGADVLLVAIKVWKLLPDRLLQGCTLLPKSGLEADLFQPSHLEIIVPYLKESSNSHPKVHPIWETLATMLSDSKFFVTTTKKSKRKGVDAGVNQSLVTFWSTVVDETLIFSSHERKHLAMRLVLLFLSKLPTSCIPLVFSNAFGRCLLDSRSSPQNLLYNSAGQFLSDLCSWAQHDEDRLVPVIASLQQYGGGKFDQLTTTSTVKDLTNGARSPDSCLSAIKNVRVMFLNSPIAESETEPEPEDEAKVIKSAVWMIDLLFSFCKLPSASSAASKEVLKFLTAHLLVKLPSVNHEKLKKLLKWTPKSLRKPIEETCVLKLRAVLSEKAHARGPNKDEPEAEDLAFFVVEFFRDAWRPSSDEEDVQTVLHSLISQLTNAISDKNETERKGRFIAMRSMLSQLVIQSWLEPGSVDNVATELIICCKNSFGNAINISISADDDDGEAAPPMIDVLVDIILQLQSQASAPIRKAAEQVFVAFSSDITPAGINSMLKVVNKQMANRVNAIFDAHADDDDDDEDVVDIEEDDDDEKSGIEEPESGLESEDEAEIQDAMDEAEAEVSSDMDDEAMFRIDSQLAGILKQRKKGGSDGHSQLLEFKFRVLGLLESFIVRRSDSPLLVVVLPQLFQAHLDAGVAGNKNLANRIRAIMDKAFKAKHYPKGSEVDEATVSEMLPKLLTVVSRTRDKQVRALAQTFLFWLFKVRLATSEGGESEVGRIMSDAVGLAFDNKKSKMHIGFITDGLTRNPWLGAVIMGQLLEKCKTSRSDHYKVEAMNVVGHILKPHTKPGVASDAEFVSALEKHLGVLNELFLLYLNKPIGNTEKQAGFLRFCATAVGALRTLFPNRKVVDVEALSTAVSGFRASAKGKLKSLAENLERVLGNAAEGEAKKNKRKRPEASSEPEEIIASPKKKSKNPEQTSKKNVKPTTTPKVEPKSGMVKARKSKKLKQAATVTTGGDL